MRGGIIKVNAEGTQAEAGTKAGREEEAKSRLAQGWAGVGEFEEGKEKNVGSTEAESGATGDSNLRLTRDKDVTGGQMTTGRSKGTTHLSENVKVDDGGIESKGEANLKTGNRLYSYNEKNGKLIEAEIEADSDQGNRFKTGPWQGRDGWVEVPYEKNYSKTDGEGYTKTDFDGTSETDWEWKSSHRAYKKGNIPTEVKSWANTWVV